ncbi:hypothetical protein BJ742DRAFT_279066 [Cladochytrium replicatum]|nr:hypothetical protein BJ742DRAFT_279066 [Cladochytrium replicatum]
MLSRSLSRCAALAFVFAVASAAPQDGSGAPVVTTPSGSYSCPSTCVPPACMCASTSPPGGLSIADTPMFVTLTVDDSVYPILTDAFAAVTNFTTNPNGCPLPVTFFTTTIYTSFVLLSTLWNQGNEIAIHTVNHPDLGLNAANREAEITASRYIINQLGGIPRSKLSGFRAPFLSYNRDVFAILRANNFTYDSSVAIDATVAGYWPHTLDYGMPYEPVGCVSCGAGSSLVFPGLWEIPMYNLMTNTSTLWSTMDPVIDNTASQQSYDQALNYLKFSFDLHYKKKLPFGLYQHIAQLIAWGAEVQLKKTDMLKAFVAYTQTFPDVWYLTNQQLLQWMQSPVPASKMVSFLPCVLPPVDPSNPEICDGIDNNRDGAADTGLLNTCGGGSTPWLSTFQTCYDCPSVMPNISSVPFMYTGARARVSVPDNGCPGTQSWDPVGGKCVELKRPMATPRVAAAAPTATQTPGGKSAGWRSVGDWRISMGLGAVVLGAIIMGGR